jgi:hypothetical protein
VILEFVIVVGVVAAFLLLEELIWPDPKPRPRTIAWDPLERLKEEYVRREDPDWVAFEANVARLLSAPDTVSNGVVPARHMTAVDQIPGKPPAGWDEWNRQRQAVARYMEGTKGYNQPMVDRVTLRRIQELREIQRKTRKERGW